MIQYTEIVRTWYKNPFDRVDVFGALLYFITLALFNDSKIVVQTKYIVYLVGVKHSELKIFQLITYKLFLKNVK